MRDCDSFSTTTRHRRRSRAARRAGRFSALALAILALVGCGESAEGTGVAGEVSFDLAGENHANVSGARAVLHYVDEGTTLVTVDGLEQAEQPGLGPNPVRIVEGSCDDPGAIAFQLPALSASGSEKRLKIGIDELYEGSYAVQVLFSKDEDRPMACGEIQMSLPPDSGEPRISVAAQSKHRFRNPLDRARPGNHPRRRG
jgi:hypothetical protein